MVAGLAGTIGWAMVAAVEGGARCVRWRRRGGSVLAGHRGRRRGLGTGAVTQAEMQTAMATILEEVAS